MSWAFFASPAFLASCKHRTHEMHEQANATNPIHASVDAGVLPRGDNAALIQEMLPHITHGP